MKHIHLDAVGGVAGDMFVAAMLDMLPDLRAQVEVDIKRVLPAGIGDVEIKAVRKNGMHAQSFNLIVEHDDGHADDHLGHAHKHAHDPSPIGSGSYRDIDAHIRGAGLDNATVNAACGILKLLATAEAKTHAVDINDVHFHEIADWDSVIDVVAAGSIIAALGDVWWSVSDLPRGRGLVKTQHGLLPVPAPATVELLEGFGWRDDGIAGERVTPTGAAILRFLIDPTKAQIAGNLHQPKSGQLTASGTGAGTRNIAELPNILRVMQFETGDQEAAPTTDQVVVVEFEIDDMTGEEIGRACAILRDSDGVIDLLLLTGQGKKNRPVTAFRLLVEPEQSDAVMDACFAQTSTIGLRHRLWDRRVLARSASTDEHGMRLKHVARPAGQTSCKIEDDDLIGTTLTDRRAQKMQSEFKR